MTFLVTILGNDDIWIRLFPGSIGDQCETFVEQYGQAVIDALVQGQLSPKEVIIIIIIIIIIK